MEKFQFKDESLQRTYENRVKELKDLADSPVNNPAYLWDEIVQRYAAAMERTKKLLQVEGISSYITAGMMKNLDTFLKKCSDAEFHIALVGAIKAGKSTLINALLGYEYASTKVTPETAALTKFKKSDDNYVKLLLYTKEEWDSLWKSAVEGNADIFLEEYKTLNADEEKNNWLGISPRKVTCNTQEELVKEITRWTSSKSPVHYFVKEVEVGLKDFELPKGVVLVDTPGLDDIVEYRSDITRDYIDRANAVLVCVKSDALTGQEMHTIYSVFSNVRYNPEKVFVIATQLDTLNRPLENWQAQRLEWIKHLKRKGAFGNEQLAERNLIPVSAYLYTLLKEYNTYAQDDQSDKMFDLKSILFKLRVCDLHANYQMLCDFTQIETLKRKINNDIVVRYKKLLTEDVTNSYLICKEEIQNSMRKIKKEQEDIIKTSQGGIEEIRKKQKEFTQKYEETKDDKRELESMINRLQTITQKRADELERAIKALGR